MICPSCGSVNEDGVLFCDRCKADLDMPPAQFPQTLSPVMNESDPIPLEPIALEPIGLEPIALEPGAPGALLENVPAITLEPAETLEDLRKNAATEPPPLPSAESTGDLPAVPDTGPVQMPFTPQPGANPKLIVLRGQRMEV